MVVDRYRFPVLTVMITFFTGINGQMITVKPMPTGGTIGQRAHMNCSVDTLGSDTLWWFRAAPATPGEREIIYTSPDPDVRTGYTDAFEIEIVDNIQYNLHFKNVQQGQEMIYGCELRNEIDQSFSAQFMTLTGADCNPKPNSGAPPIEAGGSLVSSCSVSHYGSMEPKLEWYNENGLVTSVPVEDEENPEHMTLITNLTAIAEHDEMEFECRVQFEVADGNGNIPIYHDHCLSARQVLHSPTNMEIYPEPAGTITIGVGEEVNCTASARPPATFNWYSSGGEIYQGDTLTITDDMIVNEARTYNCTATNTVNGNPRADSRSITLYVVDNSTPAPSTGPEGWVIAIAVIVPLAIIGAVVGVGLFFFMKRKNSEPSYPPPSRPHTGAPVSTIPNPNSQRKPSESSGKGPGNVNPYTGITQQGYPGRASPGYADLGVKQMSGSGQNLNVSVESANGFYPAAAPRNTTPTNGYPNYDNTAYKRSADSMPPNSGYVSGSAV